MRIHHLDCGSMCPYGRALIHGTGSLSDAAELCCHCLLIESSVGLILVDTGFGSLDLRRNDSRIPWHVRALLRPVLDPARTALAQIKALGFSPHDVRHVVVTHLDFDHAGGLSDFPEATVHVFADEHRAAMKRATFPEKQRYLPNLWAHHPKWNPLPVAGESFFGFDSVRAIHAKETDVLVVPVHGHSRGHAAIAVRHGEGYLLHCGDAYFHHAEMKSLDPSCPPGLAAFQSALAYDNKARLGNQARLRALQAAQGPHVQLFSAHDPVELERLQQRARDEGQARSA